MKSLHQKVANIVILKIEFEVSNRFLFVLNIVIRCRIYQYNEDDFKYPHLSFYQAFKQHGYEYNI